MKGRQYFAVMPFGYLTLIEISDERRREIDEKYKGDAVEYYEEVILREFDFSQSDTWTILTETSMFCYGESPNIPNQSPSKEWKYDKTLQ